MPQVATILLVICIVLCSASVISFSWSFAASRVLLLCANVAAAVGALEIALTTQLGGLATWAILFASGAFSCGVVATRQLKDRSSRWVHRYVIYAGFAATFTAMAIAALWLHEWSLDRLLAQTVLIVTYVVGCGCIIVAKGLIVQRMVTQMPEYFASLSAGPYRHK
jgi:hypothetical protein